jgi:cell wall-associated NlpC family hydrolase
MVYTAERSARNAENDRTNSIGMCLQQTRSWAGISARYGDAATAWRNTNDRHPGDRTGIPRGAFVFWTGGSRGYGHVAMSLGGGRIRSTDAGGAGRVATVTLGWFDSHWPSLRYAGWSWDLNEIAVPHRS